MSMGTPTGGFKVSRPVGIPCIDTRETEMSEGGKSLIAFFMPMIPPTVTAQEHQITVRNGKPVVYDTSAIKEARAKLTACLAQHKPEQSYTRGVRLIVKWCFPRGRHKDGEYRITKPDTDNLQKLLKDCMTRCGFWKDDALVASEVVEKFWSDVPGIYIMIYELGGENSDEQSA